MRDELDLAQVGRAFDEVWLVRTARAPLLVVDRAAGSQSA
jgi:hypothetical protein